MEAVELGFVEKTDSWRLRSKFFPSKVGGKPSWLSLDKLPEPSELTCKTCGCPFIFLMQVYANIDERDDTFHRTLFIFMCSNGKCIKRFSNDGFVVFRCQLPRKNNFYAYEPPTLEEKSSDSPSVEQYQNICNVCGCKAFVNCEKCNKIYYCSDHHRSNDHAHRAHCGSDTGAKKKKKPKNKFLLPEYEIESDTEYLPPEKPEKSDDEKMKEYQQFMKSAKAPKDLQDVPLDDFDSITKKNDKAFNKFRKRIEPNPEQILRYQRGGNPLLVSAECVPSEADIPPCQCGAKRIFEFQIMSQILLYLSLDSVQESPDWGTLLIYTCSKSCEAGTGAYVPEFLWKQDFSDG